MNFKDKIAYRHSLESDERLATKKDLAKISKDVETFQFEPGIVLDIILDDGHPKFKKLDKIADVQEFPPNYINNSASASEPNYTNIGCARVRMCHSQENVDNEDLHWMYPLEIGRAHV